MIQAWDARSGACIAIRKTESENNRLSRIHPSGRFAVGHHDGSVSLMRIHAVPMAPPLVTAGGVWRFGDRAGAGRRDDAMTTICPGCGRRFPAPARVLKTITKIHRGAGFSPGCAPCFKLDDAAWKNPFLLSECPHCRQSLRFNPFLNHHEENPNR